MCGSILRAISKARGHQSDTECSVRGEWFTGLVGVSTRPWKTNSKAKLSIPSISQLSALTGVTRSNSCSFSLLCRICLQQQQQQKWGVRERNQLAKPGFSLVRKKAVFRHFWGTHQCGDTSVRWNETLYSLKQLWGMHRNLKNNVKLILNSCSEEPPSMTDAFYHRKGSPSKRARFSDKQRKFMVEKFYQGERSGRKIGPASADCCWLEEK